MSDLNKLKELADLESYISFWKTVAAGQVTPSKNEIVYTVWFLEGLAQLDITFQGQAERLEAAEARAKELEGDVFVIDREEYKEDMDNLAHYKQLTLKLSTSLLNAKAELSRRDKEAGEPACYVTTGFPGIKEDYTISKILPVGTALYAAAQPAFFPPEMDSLKESAGYRWWFAMGYNRAIADAKALGVKPLRVKLPEGYSTRSDYVVSLDEVREALKSYGIEVEE